MKKFTSLSATMLLAQASSDDNDLFLSRQKETLHSRRHLTTDIDCTDTIETALESNTATRVLYEPISYKNTGYPVFTELPFYQIRDPGSSDIT